MTHQVKLNCRNSFDFTVVCNVWNVIVNISVKILLH